LIGHEVFVPDVTDRRFSRLESSAAAIYLSNR